MHWNKVWFKPLIIIFVSIIFLTTSRCNKQQNFYNYKHTLKPVKNDIPILADYPEFIKPIDNINRLQAPPLINTDKSDLEVLCWRYSKNLDALIQMNNKLKASETAVLIVHPWGIDDGQGWNTPEPDVFILFGKNYKNEIYQQHVSKVLNPFLNNVRNKVKTIVYTMPGDERKLRTKLYSTIYSKKSTDNKKISIEVKEQLKKEIYHKGQPLPVDLKLNQNLPVTTAYFEAFGYAMTEPYMPPELFSQAPLPISKNINYNSDDIVFFDSDGYKKLKEYL